jgi:hypothetical protein
MFYVVFIITICFDPCVSSSGDRINLSESNTTVTGDDPQGSNSDNKNYVNIHLYC